MIAQFYENLILKNPKSILIILLVALVSFGYYSKDFRLDASSETLLIEDDPDLKYNQVIRPWKSRLAIFYIRNQSIILDLKLICLTVYNFLNIYYFWKYLLVICP